MTLNKMAFNLSGWKFPYVWQGAGPDQDKAVMCWKSWSLFSSILFWWTQNGMPPFVAKISKHLQWALSWSSHSIECAFADYTTHFPFLCISDFPLQLSLLNRQEIKGIELVTKPFSKHVWDYIEQFLLCSYHLGWYVCIYMYISTSI